MNTLKLLREKCGVSTRDIVDHVQRSFPKFDKTSLSKCCNQEYGIELPEAVVRDLYRHFAPEMLKALDGRKADRHKWTKRASCRLADVEFEALQQAAERNGMTVQQFTRSLLLAHLKELEYLPADWRGDT